MCACVRACVRACVCICAAIPFVLDVRFVGVPAGVSQEEGNFYLWVLCLCRVKRFHVTAATALAARGAFFLSFYLFFSGNASPTHTAWARILT